MSSQLATGVSALVVAALWANGRYRRSRWRSYPEIELVYGIKPKSRTAIVVFTGAFNSGRHHTAPVMELLRNFGDVFIVEYPLRRFSAFQHCAMAYERVTASGRYDTVVLYGSSMGGSLALSFARMAQHRSLGRRLKIELILSDVPPSGNCLPGAARLTRYVRPGPLVNLFSSLVTRQMFKMLPDELLVEEYDNAQLDAHIKAMRRYRLSAMCEQISAIVDQPVYDPDEFRHVAACLLCSGNDGVIDGERAEAELRSFLPRLQVIPVDAGCHTSVVEHPISYARALLDAFAHHNRWIVA